MVNKMGQWNMIEYLHDDVRQFVQTVQAVEALYKFQGDASNE